MGDSGAFLDPNFDSIENLLAFGADIPPLGYGVILPITRAWRDGQVYVVRYREALQVEGVRLQIRCSSSLGLPLNQWNIVDFSEPGNTLTEIDPDVDSDGSARLMEARIQRHDNDQYFTLEAVEEL